jgi:hypothetical protein
MPPSAQARCAVCVGAGEYDANRALVLVRRKGFEQAVDRHGNLGPADGGRQPEQSMENADSEFWRDDIDMPAYNRRSVFDDRHDEGSGPRQ